MAIFDDLEGQYNSIDNQYATGEFQASRSGATRKEAEFRKKREINDQAYFLFMFSRLEDRVNQEAEKLIKRKTTSRASWKQKAPWDNLPKEVKDIPFKNRLALLAERGKQDFNLISDYYLERNSIAHGGGFKRPINMPDAIANFIRLYKAIRA